MAESESARNRARPLSALRAFLDSSAAGGLVLMGAAVIALLAANSPFAPQYFGTLKTYVGPLSVLHWINDALMALFFLVVGLEIKRELLDGHLSTWNRRILPGIAAAGGMIVPALIFAVVNWDDPRTIRGWAVPTATDIAFALGVLSLLGSRIPASLKIFLTALAIVDDLGAVLIIALFYSGELSLMDLAAAAAIFAALLALNRANVQRLAIYLVLGALLWFFVLRSGIHATIAGVLLALTIPLTPSPGRPDNAASPLHRLEHALHGWVTFLVVPVFGFANAGVPLTGITAEVLFNELTLGVALGLFLGKLIGVFGTVYVAIRLGIAEPPIAAGMLQIAGVALLCGIGFTMSLFIGLLAFEQSELLQEEVKIGILLGSFLSGIAGYSVLRFAPRRVPAP